MTLQFTKQYDAATRSTLPGSCLWRFGATGHTQLGFDCENAALLLQHHQLQPASAGYRTHERLAAGSWRLRGVGTAPAGGGRKAMTVVRVSAGETNRQTAFVVVRINGQMFAVSADLLVAPLEGGPTGPHKQQPLVTSAGDIGGSSVRGVTVGGSANTTTSGGDRNATQFMHCVLLSAVAPLLRAAASAAGCSDGSGNAVQAPTAAHITRCDVYLGEVNLHGYVVHLRLVPDPALAPQRQSQLVPAAGEMQPARQPLQAQVQAPAARALLPAAAAAQLNFGVPHRCAQVQAQVPAQAAAEGFHAQVGTGPIDQAGAAAAVADPDAAEACAVFPLAQQPQPVAERRQLHKPTGLEPRPCGEFAALVAAAVTVADPSATAAGVSNTAPAAPGAAAATAQAEVARHAAPCEGGSSSDGSSSLDLSNLLLQPAKLLAVAATAWPATTAAAAAPAMVASAAAGRVGPSPNHTVFVRLCSSSELLPLPQQLCPLGEELGPVETTEVQHQSVPGGSGGALLGDGWAFEPQAPGQCCIRLLSPAGPLAPDATQSCRAATAVLPLRLVPPPPLRLTVTAAAACSAPPLRPCSWLWIWRRRLGPQPAAVAAARPHKQARSRQRSYSRFGRGCVWTQPGGTGLWRCRRTWRPSGCCGHRRGHSGGRTQGTRSRISSRSSQPCYSLVRLGPRRGLGGGPVRAWRCAAARRMS